MNTIPKNLIITKCNESKYKINDTIVNLQRKLKIVNSFTTAFLNQTQYIKFQLSEKIINTFLSFNPWWKQLNYKKEIINEFNGNSTTNTLHDCYSDITNYK